MKRILFALLASGSCVIFADTQYTLKLTHSLNLSTNFEEALNRSSDINGIEKLGEDNFRFYIADNHSGSSSTTPEIGIYYKYKNGSSLAYNYIQVTGRDRLTPGGISVIRGNKNDIIIKCTENDSHNYTCDAQDPDYTYQRSIVSENVIICPDRDHAILTGLNHSKYTTSGSSLCRNENYTISDKINIGNENNVGVHGQGDWAPNWYKRECPVGYVVVAIANHGATLICGKPSDHSLATSRDCTVKWFNQNDNGYVYREMVGDWAPHIYKGEVGNNSYIAGIASYNGTNQISAILSCPLK